MTQQTRGGVGGSGRPFRFVIREGAEGDRAAPTGPFFRGSASIMMPFLVIAATVAIWLIGLYAGYLTGFLRGVQYARRQPFTRDWESKRQTIKALTGVRPRCVASVIWVGNTGEAPAKDDSL